jgi:aminocarboxymuconate-semialdehyde decarboxylase
MFGTDWPHQVHDTQGAFANTAQLPAQTCATIRGSNALKVFNIS